MRGGKMKGPLDGNKGFGSSPSNFNLPFLPIWEPGLRPLRTTVTLLNLNAALFALYTPDRNSYVCVCLRLLASTPRQNTV